MGKNQLIYKFNKWTKYLKNFPGHLVMFEKCQIFYIRNFFNDSFTTSNNKHCLLKWENGGHLSKFQSYMFKSIGSHSKYYALDSNISLKYF